MSNDVRTCELRCRRKPGPGLRNSLLRQDLSSFVLDRIALDILGPLPLTSNGNKYILVVSDYFTKYAEAYALLNHTAIIVADKLVCDFVCRFGVPLLSTMIKVMNSNLNFSSKCVDFLVFKRPEPRHIIRSPMEWLSV